jgi:hypothetical protein
MDLALTEPVIGVWYGLALWIVLLLAGGSEATSMIRFPRRNGRNERSESQVSEDGYEGNYASKVNEGNVKMATAEAEAPGR